ncbi:hypothetical protein BV898_15194 [Hypsibius exemplaris]|uniref:Uncharacterized protein n=1 Tax=Hypsibius exemplaris TaxID=2072580 RepID=A0A9X6NC61_HYPEX|nr:hypothetical protein BV898_15194 [Hypsibius exemplaris]
MVSPGGQPTETTRLAADSRSNLDGRRSCAAVFDCFAMQTVCLVALLACVCGVYGGYEPVPALEYEEPAQRAYVAPPRPQPRYVDPPAPQYVAPPAPRYVAPPVYDAAPRYRRGYGPAPEPAYVAPNPQPRYDPAPAPYVAPNP